MALQRLGRGAARHKWLVVAVWIIVAIGLASARTALGGRTRDVFSIPGTDSQAALTLLQERFPVFNQPTATVVFDATTGALRDAPDTQAVNTTIANIKKLPNVGSVTNPLTTSGPSQVSTDGTIAIATVTYDVDFPTLLEHKQTFDELETATAPAQHAGLTVEYGGEVTDAFNQKVNGISAHADEIGLGIAVIILLLAFGSVMAMLLPLGTALLGLGVALSLLGVFESAFTIGSVAPILGTMIGLGVGIDYSLFVVSRYRQNVADGMSRQDAIAVAIGTAGSAVLFAGITVCLATAGLALARIPYLATMGFSAALVVAVMVCAALTLLPALIAIVGTRIDKLGVPGMHHSLAKSQDSTLRGWARWAREVAKRPWRCVISSLVVLLVLAAPVLDMRTGWTDDGDEPTQLTQRRAYDLITRGFGPGANGPLLIAVALPAPTTQNEQPDINAALKLVSALKAAPGIDAVTPPLPNSAGTAAVIIATPHTAPSASATKALVRNLRATVIPQAVATTSIVASQVHVGGQTAILIDLVDRIAEQLPFFIGAVVLGSFLLLMMVFRSLFVPLKAAVMNLLSIGAAYGVVVAVFQWGWAKDVIGLHQTVPIVAFVPLMMFAILFGLSMDYEVFLLSRIREEWIRTGDNRDSVVEGLSTTARVITSAALIMIAVFLSFVTNDQPTVKMMGLGLAAAVFVDATLVRMVLVPATMELLGKWNWWMPGWLDRALPNIEVERGPVPAAMISGSTPSAPPATDGGTDPHSTGNTETSGPEQRPASPPPSS